MQFVSTQQLDNQGIENEEIDGILDNIVGVLPDEGKSLEDYRKERITERYEFTD